METFAFFIESWLATLASWARVIPLGFAFGAGMVAAFNPCGFALLPAYLSLHLRGSSDDVDALSLVTPLLKALLISLLVTVAFVLVFGLVGVAVGTFGRFVIQTVPWVAVAMGVGLVAMGIWLLIGKKLFTSLGARAAAKVGDPAQGSFGSFFFFGVTYALASLSCTLPIFLVVVVSAVAAGGIVSGLVQFLSYALGMGAVIVLLTLTIVAFKGAMIGVLQRGMVYVERAGGVLLIVAGLYLLYYWLFIGRLIETFT
jgi:cytochrome c biogenesis protein CcdA